MSANESGSRYVSVLLICSAVAAADECPATNTPQCVEPEDVVDALVVAITADTDLPISAVENGVEAKQIDFTAKNKGECANELDIRFNYNDGEELPENLTAAITAMSGGSGNPDIDEIITALNDEQFHMIVVPWLDATNLGKLETELDTRWGPLEQNDGYAGLAKTGDVFCCVHGKRCFRSLGACQ